MPLRASVPHGIVFIMDMTHDNVVSPEYTPDNVVASNAACVSIATTHEVDGETEFEISRTLDDRWANRLLRVFSSSIETPGEALSIVTSNNEVLMTMETGSERTSFEVFVDALDSPEVVVVVASDPA